VISWSHLLIFRPSLSLSGEEAAPIHSNHHWPSMAVKHQSDIDCRPFTHLQNRPSKHCHCCPWPGRAPLPPCVTKDIISDLSPVFDSIPELCTSSGPSILTKGSRLRIDVFCQVGLFLSNSVPPLGSILGTDPDLSHLNSCTRGSIVTLGFLCWTNSLRLWVGSPPQLRPSLLREDHVNNHVL